MVIVIILFFVSLLRKDLNQRLRSYYGVKGISDFLISKQHSYINNAESMLKGENPFNQRAHLFINGHTHEASLMQNENGTIYADSGSWKKMSKRVDAKFNFPAVFIPFFSLTYLVCEVVDDSVKVELREWPRDYEPELTMFERFIIKDDDHIPLISDRDRSLHEITMPII